MDTTLPSFTFNDLPEFMDFVVSRLERLEQSIRSKHDNGSVQTDERRLSVNEAAEYLGCSRLTVMKGKKSGALPFHQFGKVVYFKASELDAATLVPAISYEKKK